MTDLITPATPSRGSDSDPSERASEVDSTTEPDASTATHPAAAPPRRPIVRRILRYVLVLVVLAGLAAGAVYAAPIINDRFIQPVETNIADTAALQTSAEDSATRIDQLETETAALRTDLDTTTVDLESVAESTAANSTRIDNIDTLIADQTTRIDSLDEITTTLGIAIQTEASSIALQIDFLKSTELLSRARLFLYQANYGLAEQDVQAASDLLAALLASQDENSPIDTVNLASALSRIDLVLDALPNRPVAASDDLDIAWRLLLDDPLSPLLATTNATDPTIVDPSSQPSSGLQD